jgi:hypothetical protein
MAREAVLFRGETQLLLAFLLVPGGHFARVSCVNWIALDSNWPRAGVYC